VKTRTSPSVPPSVAELIQCISVVAPDAALTAEPGGVKAGNWWVEIKRGARMATVEWRPSRGFGIYGAAAESYGEGPKEIFQSVQMVGRRVVQLLSARKSGGSWLKTLRELYGLSQVQVATRLGIQQGNISKLERRSRVQLNTLINVVAIFGGSIEIRAKFPEAELPLDLSAVTQHLLPSRPRKKVVRTARKSITT